MNKLINGRLVSMTEAEIAAHAALGAKTNAERIACLKARLAETDYKTLKFFEGELSDTDYLASCVERSALRSQINALEATPQAE